MVTTKEMEIKYPRASLICRANSHPFQDRIFSLCANQQPTKVGRAVARSRPSSDNAIFDCKVLSRNHALIWYEDGKFYIQDTKSSNGTFVNNSRLSKTLEVSSPHEVCSGDILQFGVDVVENTKKVTHGCIIATLKLYLQDGKEAKSSNNNNNSTTNSSTNSSSMTTSTTSSTTLLINNNNNNLPHHDLYELNQYLQDAIAREQMLETKLAVLQRIVGQTESASGEVWKSLIDEDRLLTRVEILETQLSAYGKTDDKLRAELSRCSEEKEAYQQAAKTALKKLMDEKLEAVKRAKETETALSNSEDEVATLKELYDKTVSETQLLCREIAVIKTELEKTKSERDQMEDERRRRLKEERDDNNDDNDGNNDDNDDNENERVVKTIDTATETDDISTTAILDDAKKVIEDKNREILRLELHITHLESVLSKLNIDPMTGEDKDPIHDISGIEAEDDEKEKEKEEKKSLHLVNELQTYERNLALAEQKIAKLILVKEKYVNITASKQLLEKDNQTLKTQLRTLHYQSRTATACSAFSVGVLVMALIIAFLPYLNAVSIA